MKMMDIAHEGSIMLDEALLHGAPPAPLGLSDLGDPSDHLSLLSSAASTPLDAAGAGFGGSGGGGGGSGTGGSAAAALAAPGGAAESNHSSSHGGSSTGGSSSSSSSSSKLRVQLPASCDPPLPDTPTKPLVWIVFGGTGHVGRSLVKCALGHGDYVAMVGRTRETQPAAMQALAASLAAAAVSEPGAGGDDDATAADTADTADTAGTADRIDTATSKPAPQQRCLGALCDVRSRESVDRVVQRTLAQFGRIDVVANCSGYGVVGACEDQDEHELRNQFETNFMGTLHILQATLPIFRRQQQQQQQQQQQNQQQQSQQQHTQQQLQPHNPSDGRYLIFSSTAGALGVPGLGPYCATKYAVEGLIEAMLYEVDAFNIKATLVEPGLMRRDDVAPQGKDSGGSHAGVPGTAAGSLPTWGHFLIKPPSEPYAGASSPALHATRMVQWLGDRQPASVVQCAELVWQLAHCSFPPLRLPLGSYAIESIRDRLRSVTEELDDWKHLNFPVPPDAAAAVWSGGGGGGGGGPAGGSGGKPGDSTAKTDKADRDERHDEDEEMVDIGS